MFPDRLIETKQTDPMGKKTLDLSRRKYPNSPNTIVLIFVLKKPSNFINTN